MVILFQILLAFATFFGVLPAGTEVLPIAPPIEVTGLSEGEEIEALRSVFVNYLSHLRADYDTVWRATIGTVDGLTVTGYLHDLTEEYVSLYDEKAGCFVEISFSEIQMAEFDQIEEIDFHVYLEAGNLFFASSDVLLCQLEHDASSIVYLVTFPVINPAQEGVDACGCGVLCASVVQ